MRTGYVDPGGMSRGGWLGGVGDLGFGGFDAFGEPGDARFDGVDEDVADPTEEEGGEDGDEPPVVLPGTVAAAGEPDGEGVEERDAEDDERFGGSEAGDGDYRVHGAWRCFFDFSVSGPCQMLGANAFEVN